MDNKFNDIKSFLNRDVKEFNKLLLSMVCCFILLGAGLISYFATNSYALFIDVVEGKKSISVSAGNLLDTSGANEPVLYDGMIPVYYDTASNVWKKADKNNTNPDYQWYDYNSKMWANSVTYDRRVAYDESINSKGFYFNGTSTYMDKGNASSDFGKILSVVTRFKLEDGYGDSIQLISNTEDAGFSLGIEDGKVRAMVYSTSSSAYKYLYSSTLDTDKWYTVVLKCDGSKISLYLNGEKVTDVAFTENLKVSSMPITIGAEPEVNSKIYFFKGYISDALVVKDALSDDDILKNYSSVINYRKNPNEVFYERYLNKTSGNVVGANYTAEGLNFNGVNNYVNHGYANYDFGNKITIAARFKANNLTDTSYYKILSNTESGGFSLSISGFTVKAMVYSTSAGDYKNLYSGTIDASLWHRAVIVCDGSKMRLYLDGKEVASVAFTENIKASKASLIVGGEPNASGGVAGDYFNGIISDVLVIKDVLTATQISNNFGNGFKYDLNPNELFFDDYDGPDNGTVVGAEYTSEGMKFDGDDYVDAGYLRYVFGNKISVAARFKVENLDSSPMYLAGNPSNSGFIFEVLNDKRICFQIYGVSAAQYVSACIPDAIDAGKWYTAVGTYDGSNIKLYLDDVVETTQISDTIKESRVRIFVGANPDPYKVATSYFNGVISQVVVINDVLTSSQISQYYSDEINHQENSKTLFYYNLKEYESRDNGSVIPMDVINTMQVWIPRYKYTVWNYNLDGTKFSEPQEIKIKFEKGGASTGELACNDLISGTDVSVSEVCRIKGSSNTCTDDTCNGKTYTHPAFTFGNKELEGFWVGKFEASSDVNCVAKDYSGVDSGCNLKTINSKSKPDSSRWRGAMVSLYQNSFFAMNDENNVYGLGSKSDPHVIKSSEWGAVSYLSHSKYGVNGPIALNSNASNLTGCGPQASGSTASGELCNSYETNLGQSSSTTGNIYGIYDMSGGGSEYTMANIVSTDGVTMMTGSSTTNNNHSGYSGVLYESGGFASYTGSFNYPHIKYYDRYSYNTSSNNDKLTKLGDGLKEVLNTTNYSWYSTSNNTSLPISTNPWWPRGAAYGSGGGATIFSGGNTVGLSSVTRTSRFVIS